MDPLQKINHWLSTSGTYADGVELYNQLGSDNYLKASFFTRPASSFTHSRLIAELRHIQSTYQPIMQSPVVLDNNVQNQPPATIVNENKKVDLNRSLSIDDFFNLPQQLQRHRLSISQLFSQVITMRLAIKRELNLPSKGTITLQEAFHQMSQLHNGRGVPCQLLWITYNEQTGRSGNIMKYNVVLKFGNKTATKFKPSTPANSDRRDPRHDIHGTCNVQLTETLEIKTIHTWLIFQCNGFDVTISENG